MRLVQLMSRPRPFCSKVDADDVHANTPTGNSGGGLAVENCGWKISCSSLWLEVSWCDQASLNAARLIAS